MDEKKKPNAEKNARVGGLFYHSYVDAQGYPNGMPYWGEMSADDKYWWAVTGISTLEDQARAGFITMDPEIGLGRSAYGEGACLELLQWFKDHEESDKKELEERISTIQAAFGAAQKEEEKE